MQGKNPQRTFVIGDGNHLDVVAIFATVQGEGPRAGQPAIFVRLGGCNLACKFCDTEFEKFENFSLADILAKVEAMHTIEKLVVITGGEPIRQPIAPLCQKLLDAGFAVQIETNGTMWRELPHNVEIVCAPKTGTLIKEELAARVFAYKYLISDYREKYMELPPITHNRDVYIQPIDEGDAQKNVVNFRKAQDLARKNGYKLSIQMHKVMGIE